MILTVLRKVTKNRVKDVCFHRQNSCNLGGKLHQKRWTICVQFWTASSMLLLLVQQPKHITGEDGHTCVDVHDKKSDLLGTLWFCTVNNFWDGRETVRFVSVLFFERHPSQTLSLKTFWARVSPEQGMTGRSFSVKHWCENTLKTQAQKVLSDGVTNRKQFFLFPFCSVEDSSAHSLFRFFTKCMQKKKERVCVSHRGFLRNSISWFMCNLRQGVPFLEQRESIWAAFCCWLYAFMFSPEATGPHRMLMPIDLTFL